MDNPKKPFIDGEIVGVQIRPLQRHQDKRGWLCEVFRTDELDATDYPSMGYVSLSHPGVVRGPHEHREQADFFVFMGPGHFKLWLWDNRAGSSSFWVRQTVVGGESHPLSVLVPPGVVHAYCNISAQDAFVLNFPNRLFAGKHKKEPVDEIRHEDDVRTLFALN